VATGAAIGSAVVGGAGLIQGKRQGDKAQAQADQALANSQFYGGQQLDFSQELLDNWEQTFGGIQENLSDYYNNLDPNKYATEYKSNLYENIDKQMGQLNETLASQGLQSSGMRAQAEKEAAFGKATGAAQADLMAEDKVASMKQSFLNFGENQRSTAQTGMINAYSTLAGNSNIMQQQSMNTARDAAGFMKGGLDMLGNSAGAMAGTDWGKQTEKDWFG